MLWREGLRFAANLPGSGCVASRLAALAPLSLWEQLFDYPDRLGDHGRRKLLAALERIGSFEEFYLALTSCFTEDEKRRLVRPEFLSGRSGVVLDEMAAAWRETSGSDFQARLSLLDLALWIPFSVVNRLDKLNMASAVEARSPFLDYRLVEQALAMPLSMKRAGGRNKLVLRKFLAKLLPKELIDPGKQAFYAPLTGETRDSFERLVEVHLSAEAVARRGWFAPEFVAGLRAFRFGNMLANRQLTALLMLELWATEHLDGASGRA
jgi:asparagine synthase (glutamine-hydrolysing)